MEKESISPVIQKNTPIKRLGLSRKRKSSGNEYDLKSKIQACCQGSPVNTNTPKRPVLMNLDSKESPEIELLKEEIAEGKKKIETIKSENSDIVKLENLIEIWKTGCKKAFLHFCELLKERESEQTDLKAVLNKLGIWNVMLEHFGNDSELSLLEYN